MHGIQAVGNDHVILDRCNSKQNFLFTTDQRSSLLNRLEDTASFISNLSLSNNHPFYRQAQPKLTPAIMEPNPSVKRPTVEAFFKSVHPSDQTEKTSSLRHNRLASSPLVKILVGPNERVFEFPRDLLSHYSPYFKACFNGPWKESTSGVLRLPEDKPAHFTILGEYIRGQEVKRTKIVFEDEETALKHAFEIMRFADKYQILDLCGVLAEVFDRIEIPDKDVTCERNLAVSITAWVP